MTTQHRSLEGKVGVVTGAARGIGAGIATNLASKGCNLILNYTSESSEERCTKLACDLASTHNIKAYAVRADMSTSTGPATLIAATRSHFAHASSGDLTISIIVNNAGVAGNRFVTASISSSTADSDMIADFQKQYNTNVLGPLLLMQAALPYLPYDRSGRIVNLSSVSSSLGFPGQSVYGGTKAALEAMTRTWARELSERATVNAVNPGPVDTDMYAGVSGDFAEMIMHWQSVTPGAQLREGKGGDSEDLIKFVKEGNNGKGLGGRAASVQEIAGVVGMLVSEEGGWCTGSVVCANGGMRFSM